jgi:segregation and condensation protein B
MERALRLIEGADPERLVRVVEGLLVVTSTPLGEDELAAATGADAASVSEALARLAERYAPGRSGIVLEHVAGGYAFAAAPEAAEACARLFDRPAGRGLSPAALETLAIVAYLGPCSRPEIARIRGVNVDGVVTGLLDRGMLAEDGRDEALGAVRYRTTPLFERVFGLESLAELPRVDELDSDVEELRERLESLAERRGA